MKGNPQTVIAASACTMTVVDVSVDADQTVSASPAYLDAIYVNVALSAHAVNIKNGGAIALTIPASSAAGTKIECYGATFSDNLVVASDNAGTGKIVLFWRN